MYLNTIALHNFRCFEELNIHFNPRLSVIVGNNGSGKSTVLEAAAIAAGTLTAAMDGLTNYGIKKSDAHYKYFNMGSVIDVQPQFPVSIEANGIIDNRSISWTRTLNSAKGRGSLSNAKELTSIALEYQQRMRQGDSRLILPVISYYGTGRLWNQHREKKNDTFEKNTRTNGYIDSLDGAANDKLMIKWFQKMTIQQYQRQTPIPELNAVCHAMEQCFQAITGYSDIKIQFNLDTNEIDVIYTDNIQQPVRIPLLQLSDGYKCTISLIADIAYRMAILNPQLLDNVVSETPGIILIDEIDLHLHPSWQRRILNDLTTIFPKVQFIVSTHAPAVISSIKSESLIILKDNEAISASDETYGKDVNTIFREIMEVSERPQQIKVMFDQFYTFLDENRYEEASAILNSLELELGGNDAELNSCRVRLALEQL